MADIFARSRLRGPAITDAQLYNTDSELSKGVQAGVQGMGASLRTLAGGVGDALGADQFAADQYAAAEALNRDAALRGPRIASFEQLGQQGYSLRNMGDYAAGVVGQSIPSVLPAVAAGALTPVAWGVRGALAAGTAAYAPLETGEVIGRMREESGGAQFTGQDLAQAAGTGLLSSAVQTIPGAVVGGKIAGKAVGNLAGRTPVAPTLRQAIGHNLWEAPAEGLSEVAGTAIKQLGSGQGLDGKELLEAGIAGTIGGGALSGVGAAADYARGNVTNVTDSAKSAIQTARERLQSSREAAGQGLEGLKTTAGEVSGDAWANLAEVGRKAWEGVSESDLGKSIGEKAQTARQRMADILADPEVPEAVKANVQGMMDKVGDKTSQLYTAAVDKARRFEATRKEQGARAAFTQEARGVVDDIINGVDLTDAKAMASATTEQATRMMSEAGQKASEFTRRMGEDLMRRAGVDEETKAQVADAMANLGDKAKQAAVAAKWKAFDGLDKIKEASKGLLDEFNKGRKSVKNRDVDGETRWVDDLPGLPKRSEDYSGLQSVIAGALRPYAKRINERLDKDPAALNQVADGLRSYIEAVTDTEGRFDSIDRNWARARVAEILGDDASGLLADIAERVGLGENRQMAEKFFTELGELEQLQRSQRGLRDVVARAAPDMKEAQVKELIDESLAWARGDKFKGKTPTQAEVQFDNKRMEGKLQTLLGSKSKVYLRELEKMASPRNELKEAAPGKRDMFDEGSEFDSGVDEYDGNTSVREETPDVMLKGSGKNQRTLVGDPALARAKAPQYESDTEKRIKEYQTKYPDAQVKFVSLKDSPEMLERIPAEKAKVTAESKRLEAEMPGAENAQARADALQAFRESRLRALQDEGKGLIEIRRTRNDERMQDDDVDAMRMDTDEHGQADAAGRLEVKDREGKTTDVFDAVKMTSRMMARINGQGTWTRSDNQNDLTMMGRAFADAYSVMVDTIGNRLRPPKGVGLGDVVIGYRNGVPITARDALKADKRTAKEKREDSRTAALERMLNEDSRRAEWAQGKLDEIRARKDEDKDREHTADQPKRNVADDNAQADGKQDADPSGNIHEAAARLKETELQARYNMDGSLKTKLPVGARRPGKDAFPRMFKNALRAYETAIRSKPIGKPGTAVLEKVLANAEKLAEYAPYMDSTARSRMREALFDGNKPRKLSEARDILKALIDATADMRKMVDQRRERQEAGPEYEEYDGPSFDELPEGSPDPKAVAAKKAAFLEKAASGDKALIDELKTSTDVKGLQRALDVLLDQVATEGSAKVVDTILARMTELLQDPDAQYAATTRKYSRERTRDPVYTAGEGDYKSMVSFVGPIGPLRNGIVGTVTDDGGYAMFLTEQGATEADGYALRFDVWQREDGKWEVGVDGPEEGMASFEKYADLFDVVEGSEKDTTYSKFHEGVFSAVEMRRLFRILRDHLAAFGVKPEVITRTRETGAHTDRPRADFSFERVSKLSRERVDPIDDMSGRADPLNGKEILDYIENVLGDSVRVEFAGILHSGDFTRTDVEDLIRISVHSLDPMSVAYHESLHAFFQKLKDKGLSDVANVVMRAANSPAVVKQLRERLAHSPEALAQLNVAEERAAYAFQFSMSDPTFKLNPEPAGVFEKIAAAFRKLLGIWSDADRALHIMDYFATGQFAKHMSRRNYAAVHLATMGQGRNATLDAARDMTKPLGRLADAIVGAGSARLRDTGIPALRELADVIKRDADVQSRDAGYIPAARLARTHYLNKLVIDLKDVPREKLNDAFEGLQAERDADSPEGRLAQRKVRAYLRALFDYMGKAGVDMGDLGENYFPRVWDSHYISKHQDSFLEMLRGYGLGEDVMRKIVANEGSEQTVETERPANQHARERVLSMISAEHAAPFLRKDFWQTLEIYTTQATRRAEWARRFGKDNGRLNRLLEEAMEQGATEEQLDTARTYLKGVNGTLGDDLNPSARRLMGNLIVYQNIRLLPMAVFSSLIDPMGVMVRGGTIGDAWETLKRGIKELPKSWQKDPKFDAQHELAETLGVIDDATMSSFMSTQFTQGMVDGAARKINDAFFKYNFMEGFNRSMRVGATQAAVRFIERHVTSPNEHSRRYITELGLTPGSIVMRDGKLALTEADGLTPKQAADVRRAVNLWVDGAVLRPDAADRPIWMNDPHWALLSHLKSFVFAFHHTILKRVKHEVDHGNYTPAMVLAGYVPMMLAADLAKDMIANGGDEPEWKQGWTAADHVGYAIQRAGILGVGQFAVDAYGDVKNGGMGIGALAGPTIDQLTDAVQMVGGRQEFGSFVLKSMPANSLYRGYMDGDGAEE